MMTHIITEVVFLALIMVFVNNKSVRWMGQSHEFHRGVILMKHAGVIILLVVFTLCPLWAQDYHFERIEMTIDVGLDNSYRVEERIVVNFSTPRHGIYREIPTKFEKVRITVEDVASSDPIARDSSTPDWVTFRIGSADRTVIGLKEYRLSYTYRIGEDHNEEYDEFYYNLLGDGWQAPIKEFIFTVTFPKAVDSSMVSFVGGTRGSTRQRKEYTISSDERTISGRTLNLKAGEALTLEVQMPQGYYSALIPFADRTSFSQLTDELFSFNDVRLLLNKDDVVLRGDLATVPEGSDKEANISACVSLVHSINEELKNYRIEMDALSSYYIDQYLSEKLKILDQGPLIWETDELFNRRLEEDLGKSFNRYYHEFETAHGVLLDPYQKRLGKYFDQLTVLDTQLRVQEHIHLFANSGVAFATYLRNERLWPVTLTFSDSLVGECTVELFIDFVSAVRNEEDIRFSIMEFDKAVRANKLTWKLNYHVIPDVRIDNSGLLEIVRFLLVLDEISVFDDNDNVLFGRVFENSILIRSIPVDDRLHSIGCRDDLALGSDTLGYTDWFGNSGILNSSKKEILLVDPLITISVEYEKERFSALGLFGSDTIDTLKIDADAVLNAAAQEYFAALSASNNMIASADLKAMLDDNPDAVVLVDIRSAADFEAGHIDGAYHSAWADLGAVMEKIPTNRQVVVACYSGQTASQALGALRLAGFTNAKVLTGGMNGWKGAGFEGTETGMRALSSRSNVSSPKNDEQKVLWDGAKAYYKSVGTDGNKIIAPQALHDALDTNPKAFKVIDIRGKSDWDDGHIVGSSHIAWAQFGSILPSLSKSEKIVIVCFSGQTAGQTVGVLRAIGYDAYALQGGMNNGWKPANLPVVKHP